MTKLSLAVDIGPPAWLTTAFVGRTDSRGQRDNIFLDRRKLATPNRERMSGHEAGLKGED